jgi:ELWxxDGT repeat protein
MTLVAFLCVVGGSIAQAQFQSPRVVRDIWQGPNPSTPHALATIGDTLFFVAEDDPFAGGMQLWTTDGTLNGTLSAYQFPFGTHVTEARAWNGALYFVAYDPAVQMSQLWRSDGTFQGTARLTGPVNYLAESWRFTASGKYLYFTAVNPSSTITLPELWRTDGTQQGTQVVVQLPQDVFLSPSTLADFSGVLLFVASSPFLGDELFRTDGTGQGTSLVRDIRQGVLGSGITELVVLGDRVFFAADDGFNGKELWSTDGTEQGTQMWQPEIQFGPGSSSPTGLTVMRGELFFAADDGVRGSELWKLDPSGFAPQLVDDVNPGSAGSNPTQLRDVEGKLFFVADGGQFGAEPYFLDGTPFFTFARVMDIAPGPPSSSPEALTNLNGSLLFRAHNGFEGAEPWSTLVGPQSDDLTFHWDVRPGFESSGAAQFTLAGDKLFFTADDGFRGNELWTFENRPPVAHAGADQTVEPGATAVLSAIDSTDPDNPHFPLLSCEWRDFDGHVLSRSGSLFLENVQPGAAEYTLIARDWMGGRSEDTVNVSTPGRTVPVVTIVTPESGEPLVVGTPTEIQWTVEDPESIVESRVLLSTDNGTSYVPVCTGGPGPTGSCTWTPPTYLEQARLRVEVRDEHGDRGAQTLTIDVMGQLSGPQRLAVTVAGLDGSMALVFSDQGQYCFAESGQTEATCLFFYDPGTQVTFQPMFGPPNVFVGWSGDCTGTESCAVTMNGWRRIKATFRPPQYFDFTVAVDSVEHGEGQVFIYGSDGSFQFCPEVPGSSETCTFQYLEGTVLDVQQMTAPGTTFVGWAGDCTGDGPCAVTMDQPRQVAATFRGPLGITVTVASLDFGHGDVFLSGSDGSFNLCSAMENETHTCTFPYAPGTQVQLEAFWGTDDSTFLGWAGDCTGDGPCSVIVEQQRQVAATFQGLPYVNLYLNLVSSQLGLGRTDVVVSDGATHTCQGVLDGSVDCVFPIARNTFVSLRPVPAPGSGFIWNGGCQGVTTGICEFTMTGPNGYQGIFRGPQTLTIDVNSVDGGSGRVQTNFEQAACENTPGTNTRCSFPIPPGVVVVLTPQPKPGSFFQGWVGACSGTGPCSVTMSVARLVRADFKRLNRQPVAHAGGPYAGLRNQAITFDGSGSSDPDGDPLTYAWDFGDGTVGSGVAPSHAYSTLGTFHVTLRVSDGLLLSAPATTTVTISNALPVANPGGPYSGVRNQAIAFNGSGSSDPDGDSLTYAWNFGDGTQGTGVAPTHAYSTLGTFIVTLTVSDGNATSATATTTVTITNAPPVANAGPDRTVERKTIVVLDGRASSDPDGTITAYKWRQVSGPAVALLGANNVLAAFQAPNVHATVVLEFELKVTDNNGAVATDRVRITVTR